MIIVCDIDHTICDPTHRTRLKDDETMDWDHFFTPSLMIKDPPIPGACEGIVKLFVAAKNIDKDAQLVFLTGRMEGLRNVTMEWLSDHVNIPEDKYMLMMRVDGDLRHDYEVKGEALNHIRYINVGHKIAIDDRAVRSEKSWEYTVKMYQSKGFRLFEAPRIWSMLSPIQFFGAMEHGECS